MKELYSNEDDNKIMFLKYFNLFNYSITSLNCLNISFYLMGNAKWAAYHNHT